MRELDVLLTGYLERRYATAGAAEKAAFERVLALPDPELAAYLLQRQVPDCAAIADIIAKILERNRP